MPARNIAIDKTTGGFVFAGAALQLVADEPSIEQAVRIRLQTQLGEYHLDDPTNPKVGVPYLEQVLVKNPDLAAIDGVFRAAILSVTGVKAITSMNFSFDKATRSLAVSWQATTDTGLLISGSTP